MRLSFPPPKCYVPWVYIEAPQPALYPLISLRLDNILTTKLPAFPFGRQA